MYQIFHQKNFQKVLMKIDDLAAIVPKYRKKYMKRYAYR